MILPLLWHLFLNIGECLLFDIGNNLAVITGLPKIIAQAPNYECPDVAVSERMPRLGLQLEYDPSEAIEECGGYIGANYAGPGTLTMTTSLRFTITNSTGTRYSLTLRTSLPVIYLNRGFCSRRQQC